MLRCTKEPLNLDHSAASCERVNTPHLVNTPPLVQEHEGGEPCDAVLLRQLPVGDRRLAVDCQDVQHTPVPLHGTGATFKQPPVREDAAVARCMCSCLCSSHQRPQGCGTGSAERVHLRQALQDGLHHTAGATPAGTEVQQHRLLQGPLRAGSTLSATRGPRADSKQADALSAPECLTKSMLH